MVNVTVEARNDVDNPGVVKLQSETWELNVWATTDELWKLAGIEKADWVQRRALQVGTCAHAPVWWNEQDQLFEARTLRGRRRVFGVPQVVEVEFR
jgi:hypothetical protein